ncbi:hypothetical protein KKB83_03890 [Patescibacteria group bacterium]|nr:hypothetical protein [Patescibacteria group bacterium]
MKLLKIDLTRQVAGTQTIDKKLLQEWLGGRGLGAYLYSQNVCRPDDPQNPLFIVAGAVTGTSLPSSSRSAIVTSSPLTGFYTASNFGGFFGAYLRSQGIMALEITGSSEKPVYLTIEDGKVEFRNASGIWGRNTKEVQEKLATDKTYSVGCIGIGGENLVRFACVKFDTRAAGRTGTGWHWGLKKLKAIVVKKSTVAPSIHDAQKLSDLVRLLTKLRLEKEKKGNIVNYSTPPYTDISSEMNTYPASNYRRNHLSEEELGVIGSDAFQKREVKKGACWSCPLACERFVNSTYRNQTVRGPEYESIWALGGSCDNFDLDAIIEASYLCDDFGLDTISTGATIAWYKEAVEKGLIDDEPVTGSRELELIELIAKRTDVGEVLAEGSVRASLKFPGTDKLLVHAKGLELPAWDPRGAWGSILHYATCSTGGDHCKGLPLWIELGDEMTADTIAGKAALTIQKQNQSAFRDSTGLCMFADDFLGDDSCVRAIESVFDVKLSSDSPQIIGEKIIQTEHEINKQLELTRQDDTVPIRILDYPMEIGGKETAIGKENFEKMREEYYKLREWEK